MDNEHRAQSGVMVPRPHVQSLAGTTAKAARGSDEMLTPNQGKALAPASPPVPSTTPAGARAGCSETVSGP